MESVVVWKYSFEVLLLVYCKGCELIMEVCCEGIVISALLVLGNNEQFAVAEMLPLQY